MSKQSASEADNRRAHGEYWAQETFVDQGVDAALLDHGPGVLGRREIRLSVQSNVRKRISIEELDGPVQQVDEAAEDNE